jgi:hypothetical protein
MEPTETTAEVRAFCSECGARLDTGARFCHQCGALVTGGARRAAVVREGIHPVVAWSVPVLAVVVLLVIVLAQSGSQGAAPTSDAPGTPLAAGRAPDISALTPEERADRLFNRVMRLVSEGHADSAAFFVPMALGAFEALTPLNAHRRYDIGLIALVTDDVALAKGQADTILAEQPTHLLGLALAARVADARKDGPGAAAFRKRLVAAEPAERRTGLPEYTDHDADIRAALDLARRP